MISIQRIAVVVAAGAALATAIVVGAAEAAILTWDGSCATMTGDNSWDAQCRQDVGDPVLTNWDTDTLPEDSADVIIPASAGQTVIDDPGGERMNSISSEASLHIKGGDACVVMMLSPAAENTIHNLNLEWGDILLKGTLTLWGTSSMERATIYDYEGGGTLINMGDLIIDGVPPDPFIETGFTLSQFANRGTVTQRGFYSAWDTTIINEGSWLIETNPSEEADFGGGAKHFINRSGADLSKTGAEPVYMSMPLVNEEGSDVIISQGVLCLFSEGNKHQGGSIQVDPGAELALFEGYPDWGIPAATLEWTGGAIEYPLPQTGLGSLRLERSTTMGIRGAADKTLYKVRLEIEQGGRVVHASDGDLTLIDAAIRNEGTYDLANGDIRLGLTSDGVPLFENKGLLRKSKAQSGEETGISTIEVPLKLDDGGKIEVADHSLTLTGGGEFGRLGRMTLGSGSGTPPPELVFAGSGAHESLYRITSGVSCFSDMDLLCRPPLQAGILRLKQGAILNVLSDARLITSNTRFVLDGGKITGAGAVYIGAGYMDWIDGTIGDPQSGTSSGNVELHASELSITGPSKTLAGKLIIGNEFQGYVTQRAGLSLVRGQVDVRYGRWTVNENVALDATSGGQFTLGGTGLAAQFAAQLLIDVSSEVTLSAPLNGSGRISVRRGKLSLTGPIQHVNSNTLAAGWWEIGDEGKPDVSAILDMPNQVIKIIGKDTLVTIEGQGSFSQLQLETNDGQFDIEDQGSYQTPGNLTNNGTIHIWGKQGTLLEVNGSFQNNKNLDVVGKGYLWVNTSFTTGPSSETVINGSITAGSVNIDRGKVRGYGMLDARCDNQGDLIPGGSPGVLTITGDYNQFPEGTLEIELGGADVSTEYDQLVVGANASLDGTVSITLIDSYVPQVGESFEILSADSVTGSFSEVNISGVLGRRDFQVVYGPQTVTLTARTLNVVSYEEWLAAKFSPSEQADPNISGATADPEGDGLENLLEYVFALRPGQADRNPVTLDLLTEEPSGDTFVTLTFPWAEGMTDTDYAVETTTDLMGTWSLTTTEIIQTVEQGQVKVFTLKVTEAVRDTVKLFARLVVNRISP